MQEKEREGDILEVPQEKRTNKKIFLFAIIGIIVIVLAILAILGYAYFSINKIPPVNLTNNETGINPPDNNLPVVNTTGVNGTTPLTNKTANKTIPKPSGPGTTMPTPCTPDKTCSYYYNLNQCGASLNDGCSNILNCQSCNSGFYCNATNKCVSLPSCTSDVNCTSLSGTCKTGLCNLTSGNCYVNYSVERTSCPGGMCHNGQCVKCINNGDCGVNESCIDGTCFNENEAFSFMWIGDDNSDDNQRAIEFAYTTNPNLEMIFSIPDGARGGRNSVYWRYANQWLKNPNNGSHIPLFMGLGNHDAEVMEAVNYSVEVLGPKLSSSLPGMKNFREGPYDVYPNGYEDWNLTYSFDYKNAHFIMLDVYYHDLLLNFSGACGANSVHNRFEAGYGPVGCMSNDMMAWLENDLKNTDAEHKFLFYHEGAQPVPGGRHTGDSLDCWYCPGNNASMPWINDSRPMKDKFWQMLAKYNVTATLVGHAHHTTVTWADDYWNQYGALYEIEAGTESGVHTAIISIKENDSELNVYAYNYGTYKFDKVFGSIKLGKTEMNYAPQLDLYNGGNEAGYPKLTKRDYNLEVDRALTGYTQLYFEAKDNNKEDNLTFRFNNLPSFFNITNWADKYRRIALSIDNKLTDVSIGNYAFDVIVSDGQLEDKISINFSVLPAQKPIALGSVIPNGSTFKSMNKIYLFCEDNTQVTVGPCRGTVEVKLNGTPVSATGAPFNGSSWGCFYSSYITEKFAWQRLDFNPRSWNNELDMLSGRYDITYWCYDLAGHISGNYSLTFYYQPEGTDTYNGTPWVTGIYPFNGSTVNALDRISVFISNWIGSDIHSSIIKVYKDGVEFNDYSIQASTIAPGGKDIVFNSPAKNGTYEIKVTPVQYFHDYLYGDNYTYILNVDSGSFGGTSAQAESLRSEQPSLSLGYQIYKFFKGFLTGNTIKEITGYFLKIKA